MNKIKIECGSLTITAKLNDSHTAEVIYGSLPFEGAAHIWGEEIYFEIPCQIGLESDAREIVEIGSLAYWPTGNALCIFFGQTPVSTDEKPRAYSPVNVFGKVIGEQAFPEGISEGAPVKVSRHSK
jgi:hypothetical protein